MKLLLLVLVTLGAVAVPTAAVAAPQPVPIPANTMFGGTVNGAVTHATVRVACLGPVHPGQTGHPRSGQTVGIFLPEVMHLPSFGRTGHRVFGIAAGFVAHGRFLGPTAIFRQLQPTRPVLSATRPLPAFLTLPCSGTGWAVFMPFPRTAGARPAVVDVTFVSGP
jgi:hypothetical protein